MRPNVLSVSNTVSILMEKLNQENDVDTNKQRKGGKNVALMVFDFLITSAP